MPTLLPPNPTPMAEPTAVPATSVEDIKTGAPEADIATRIVIPAIGLDTAVLLAPRVGITWQTDHLVQEVGQLEGSAPPGSNSNVVIGGHYTLDRTGGGPGPFYKLKQLKPGDQVILYRGEERFEYMVDSLQKVDITAAEVTCPTDTAQITLLTCTDWDSYRGQYIRRLVVKGHLMET